MVWFLTFAVPNGKGCGIGGTEKGKIVGFGIIFFVQIFVGVEILITFAPR